MPRKSTNETELKYATPNEAWDAVSNVMLMLGDIAHTRPDIDRCKIDEAKELAQKLEMIVEEWPD